MIVPVIPELEQIQPQGVGHHAEAGKAHGRRAEHRIQRQPQGDEHPGGQGYADGVVEKRPEQVFVDVPQGGPAEPDGGGTSSRLLFISTTSAASMATSAPAPMAMPVSARVRAGAS